MTEIFGTLGPACAQADVLEKMFLEGMTGMRLNMSHSGLKESVALIRSFQQAARNTGIRPELLIDMQGPEIRIGDLPSSLQLTEREKIAFVLQTEKKTGIPAIPVAEHVLDALETGDHILLDDGRMELVITSVRPEPVANVIRGGTLQKRKSLKVTGKSIPAPAVTDQDRENIRLAKEYGVTALMQPFVTEGEQLLKVRRELQKNHMDHARIFAKIENREGMENIRDIIPYADMIVIARGDLGNDMPLWELPTAQKRLSDICRKEGKPFLVVTQLLASMVQHSYPTRAEVSDIFHAVMDGAAAVMVTNETAVGKYPAEVIRYLKKTVQEAEKWHDKNGIGGKNMNIIENVNEKLTFDRDEICAGGENDIEEITRVSPVPLPEDYIEFLKQISGEDSYGPEFEVEDEGLSIWIWSAKMALEKLEEFNQPFNQQFISNAWLFGDDLGDLVYFFGTGKDGFGLYRTSAGCLGFENAEKISDTLTDFLVNGVGIDIATSL